MLRLQRIKIGMAEKQEFKIRNAKEDQMMTFINWGRKEGWIQSNYDAEYFYKADPNGYFFGEVNDQVVAIISAVAYENQTGFISFYIVKPQYRGKGYGKKIFTHAMQYLKGKNVGLDGQLSVVKLYQQWGFKPYFKTLIFSGVLQQQEIFDKNIVKLNEVPNDKLLEYENQVSPFYRPEFIKEYVEIPEGLAIGYYQNNKLRGYGYLKKAQQKYRVSPLFADTPQIARKLLNKLINFPKKPSTIIINIHDSNKEAVKICQEFGMKVTFQALRMYTQKMPKLQYDKIYAILSSDIG